MPGELTKKLLQIVMENVALKNQVRRLQGQVKFLKQHCDCPHPPPALPAAVQFLEEREARS